MFLDFLVTLPKQENLNAKPSFKQLNMDRPSPVPTSIQQFYTMQLTAKLIQVLPLQTGTSKNGEWKKQDVIVETDGQYPKKICISIWGDKINESQLTVGNELKIDFDIESREYNGRWYTDVKAWKIELAAATQGQAPPLSPDDYGIDTSVNEGDDLPF